MTEKKYRQPTVDEAVNLVTISLSREYRISCIAHWRTLYGDGFAAMVEKRVLEIWSSKKK